MSDLKIQSGRFYRTRDGRKVGPMVANRGNEYWPWIDSSGDPKKKTGKAWDKQGKGCDAVPQAVFNPDLDLIAEWTDEPEAPDLTAITTPFGLLPPETQQALRDHGGPYQIYRYDGWRVASPRTDLWTKETVFRVNPKATPFEGYAVTLFRSAREAKTAHPGCDPIFVREVKE